MIFAPFYSRFRSILSSETHRWLGRDRLKAVIAAAPRPELEQAALRVGIVGLILAYLLWYVLRDGIVEPVFTLQLPRQVMDQGSLLDRWL